MLQTATNDFTQAPSMVVVALVRYFVAGATAFAAFACAVADPVDTIRSPTLAPGSGLDAASRDARAGTSPANADADLSVLRIAASFCGIPDPAIDAWATGGGLASPPLVPEIHAGLARFTSDPDAPVTLELAQSHSFNDAATVHTFTLRPNLKFSDGSPIVAADFVKSWSRALRRSTGASRAKVHLGGIVGAAAIAAGTDARLRGAIAIDDRTLEVTLTQTDPSLIMKLADPVASVVRVGTGDRWENLWSNVDDLSAVPIHAQLHRDDSPAGAGPFRLASYVSSPDDESCVLVANPYYWGEPASIDEIQISDPRFGAGIDDADQDDLRPLYEAAVEEGVIHYTLVGQDDAPLGAVPGSGIGAVRYAVQTEVDVVGLLFDPAVPPFDDREVRRAVIAEHVAARYLPGPTYRAADRVLPEGASEAAPAGLVTEPQYAADADIEARPLLERLAGVDIRAAARQRGYYTFIADQLFEDWREAYGLAVRMHFGRGTGRAGIHVVAESLAPDRAETLRRIVNPLGASGSQVARDVSLAAERVVATEDPVERAALRYALEQVLLDEGLFLPLFWTTGTATVLAHPSVHGLAGARYPHSQFHQVRLDDAQ